MSKLLQEILIGHDHTGWRMLIGCILLNNTSRKQVDTVWPDLFGRWPSARKMRSADMEALVEVLHPLGLQNQRSKTLARFSSQWDQLDPREVDTNVMEMRFAGVGEYARDSWRMFMRDEVLEMPEPADKELKLVWAKVQLGTGAEI